MGACEKRYQAAADSAGNIGGYMDYKHVLCECGGIIGMWNKRDGFICEKCKKEYELSRIRFDRLFLNEKTGWQFPMIHKQKEG